MLLDRVEQMLMVEKYTGEKKERAAMLGTKYRQCPTCSAIAKKNKYGTDEQCPECGTDINWEVGDEK